MSFLDRLAAGILLPNEIAAVAAVYDDISAQPWFSPDPQQQLAFARYILGMYRRGLVLPEKLHDLCLVAAKRKFSVIGPDPARLDGLRVLIVEDEYFLAHDMAKELRDAGARIMGPAGSLGGALELLEHSPLPIDGALLDVRLGSDNVFPVADRLTARGVPFAFVSACLGDLPARYRSAECFGKPASKAHLMRFLAYAGSRRVAVEKR